MLLNNNTFILINLIILLFVKCVPQKRFEGTRVTVESFLAWRKQFENDMGIPAKREREGKDKNKLTGKELFLRDTTLNESDLKFLDDGKYQIIKIFILLIVQLGFNEFSKFFK